MATPPVFTAGQVLTAAQMNEVGMWRTKGQTTFTAVTSVAIDNCFSTDYTNYRLIIRYQTSLGDDLKMKLRVGGVSASTNYNEQWLLGRSTTASTSRATALTSFNAGFRSTGAFWSLAVWDISAPFLAEPTNFFGTNIANVAAYTAPDNVLIAANHSTATSYDGLELLVGSGTTTGTYTVYGYNKG